MLRARPTWVRSKENGSRSFDLYKKDVHAKTLAEGRLDGSLTGLEKGTLIQAEAAVTWPLEAEGVRCAYQQRVRLRSTHASDTDGPLGLAKLNGTFPIENDLVEAR